MRSASDGNKVGQKAVRKFGDVDHAIAVNIARLPR